MLPLFLTGVCDLGFGGYLYVFRFLIRGRLEVSRYLTGIVIPEMIYTMLAAIIVYPLIAGIDRHFILTKKRRTSSFV
jgi:rod shape-determining protein MreD